MVTKEVNKERIKVAHRVVELVDVLNEHRKLKRLIKGRLDKVDSTLCHSIYALRVQFNLDCEWSEVLSISKTCLNCGTIEPVEIFKNSCTWCGPIEEEVKINE